MTHREHPLKTFKQTYKQPFTDFILEQILLIDRSSINEGIQISETAVEDGALAVSCHNYETIKWLKERISQFKRPAEAVDEIQGSSSNEPEFIVHMEKPDLTGAFWFNFTKKDKVDIEKFPLRFEITNFGKFKNSAADVKKWKFVKAENKKLQDDKQKQGGISLLYVVDQASSNVLQSNAKWFGDGVNTITINMVESLDDEV